MNKIGKRYKIKDIRAVELISNEIGNDTILNIKDNEIIFSSYKPVNKFCEYFLVGILEEEK